MAGSSPSGLLYINNVNMNDRPLIGERVAFAEALRDRGRHSSVAQR